MASYKRNLFIHVIILLFINFYHFARSELKGLNICPRSKQVNVTTQVIKKEKEQSSIQISILNCNISVGCWYEENIKNITEFRVFNKTINECCNGYVESPDHTSCIHKYGIQNYLNAFVGILILIVIIVLFLYCYFSTNNSTTNTQHRGHPLPLDQKLNNNKNNLNSSPFLKKNRSLNNLNGTLTIENHDRYQAFLNKLEIVNNKIEASRLMEAGMSQSMINDNDDNKSSATYESIECLNRDEIIIKNEV